MSDRIPYSICALIIVSMSFWLLFTRKDMRRKTSKLFLGVLISETLQILFSSAASFVNYYLGSSGYTAQYVLCVLSYLSYYFISAICAWYFLNFIGIGHKFNSVSHALFYLPYLVTCVVPLLVPPLRSDLFRLDADGYIVSGPTSDFALIGSIFYFAVLLWAAIRFRGRLSREQNAALIFLIVMCALSSMIDSFYMGSITMSMFFISVGLFIVLLSVDNQNWVYSGTTNTYNRMTFQRHIMVDFEDKIDFDIIIIQMSREAYFDAVSMRSDSFQYLMSEVANYLKGIKNRPNVYYCERGTFLIPVFRDSNWQPDALAETIRDRFEKPWTLLENDVHGEESVMVPVRIVKGHVPSEITSMKQLLALVDLPYDAADDAPNVVIVDATELIYHEDAEKKQSEETESRKESSDLPPELTVMLDNFEDHVRELTPSERRIVLYYLNGYEISDIPDLDGITINTVRKHNKNIYRKLQISSREELMMYLDVLERCGRLEPVEAMLKEGNNDSSKLTPSSGDGHHGDDSDGKAAVNN